jgi:hypothetical protein
MEKIVARLKEITMEECRMSVVTQSACSLTLAVKLPSESTLTIRLDGYNTYCNFALYRGDEEERNLITTTEVGHYNTDSRERVMEWYREYLRKELAPSVARRMNLPPPQAQESDIYWVMSALSQVESGLLGMQKLGEDAIRHRAESMSDRLYHPSKIASRDSILFDLGEIARTYRLQQVIRDCDDDNRGYCYIRHIDSSEDVLSYWFDFEDDCFLRFYAGNVHPSMEDTDPSALQAFGFGVAETDRKREMYEWFEEALKDALLKEQTSLLTTLNEAKTRMESMWTRNASIMRAESAQDPTLADLLLASLQNDNNTPQESETQVEKVQDEPPVNGKRQRPDLQEDQETDASPQVLRRSKRLARA